MHYKNVWNQMNKNKKSRDVETEKNGETRCAVLLLEIISFILH